MDSVTFPSHLLLAGFEEQSHPLSVVVEPEVCQPGPGVGVDRHLVSTLHLHQDALVCHGVLVVVLVVLVEDGGDLLAVLPDGEERLLVVVGGDVEDEQVRPARRRSEDTGLGVHPAPAVAVAALKG